VFISFLSITTINWSKREGFELQYNRHINMGFNFQQNSNNNGISKKNKEKCIKKIESSCSTVKSSNNTWKFILAVTRKIKGVEEEEWKMDQENRNFLFNRNKQ
jgi:hypothetical protein